MNEATRLEDLEEQRLFEELQRNITQLRQHKIRMARYKDKHKHEYSSLDDYIAPWWSDLDASMTGDQK